MTRIGVRCTCGRTMQPNALAGPSSYRCGCGAGVRLTDVPRFDSGHCSVFIGGRVCSGPKIGTTSQLYVRMDSFRVADAAVLAAEPGSYPLESMRHKQFAHLRLAAGAHREDFRLDEQLQSHIDMLVETFGQPYDLVEQLLSEQQEVAETAG